MYMAGSCVSRDNVGERASERVKVREANFTNTQEGCDGSIRTVADVHFMN